MAIYWIDGGGVLMQGALAAVILAWLEVGQKRKASSVTGVSDTNISIRVEISKTEYYSMKLLLMIVCVDCCVFLLRYIFTEG